MQMCVSECEFVYVSTMPMDSRRGHGSPGTGFIPVVSHVT